MVDFIFLSITAYLIYCDAEMLQEYNEEIYKKEIKIFPMGFAIASLLFFIVFAPLYIFKRNKYFDALKTDAEAGKKIDEDQTFKTLSNLIIILTLYIILATLLSILFYLLSYAVPSLKDVLFQGVILSVLSNTVFIILIVYFLRIKDNLNVIDYLHIKKTKNAVLSSFVIPIIGSLLFAVVNFIISTANISSFSTTSPMGNALFQSTATGMVAFMVFAVFIAPLLEEIIFRGYFFTAIGRIKGKIFAIAFVALLFAFMHVDQNRGDFIAVLLVFMVGLYLTLLRFYTGSIIPSITAHYTYNIAVIFLPTLYLFFYNPSYLEFMKNKDSIRFEQKETLLLKSIEEHPDFADAYNALAWTYAENDKRLDMGLKIIDKAIELKPDSLHYRDTKAEILYKMKRYDEAIAIEKSLIEKAPDLKFFKEQLEKFEKAKEEEKNQDGPYSLPQ